MAHGNPGLMRLTRNPILSVEPAGNGWAVVQLGHNLKKSRHHQVLCWCRTKDEAEKVAKDYRDCLTFP